jgi:aryl-alcohol dehydrogenase-like predicted oxidoreductase
MHAALPLSAPSRAFILQACRRVCTIIPLLRDANMADVSPDFARAIHSIHASPHVSKADLGEATAGQWSGIKLQTCRHHGSCARLHLLQPGQRRKPTVETTPIPRTTLTVSRIGLGTWAIGGWMWGGTDEALSIATIRAAVDRGITLIDTAPVYGFGRSEEIVGKALADGGLRDQVVIATKAGLDWSNGSGKPFRNASRQRIVTEIEDSLRRLRTDVIDIYQIHWPDLETPMAETAEAMGELHAEGKIKAIGVSNFSPDQMKEFADAAPLHVAQPPFNLFERAVEEDVLPFCRSHGIATLTYGSLCRGLLSGRMTAATSFPDDDLRRFDPKFQQPRYAEYLAAVERLDSFARSAFNKRVIHLALRWALDQPGVSTCLWGARRPDQLDPVTEVMDWTLDAGAIAEIDRILAETIQQPVGPQFMAPPIKRPAS